MLMKEDAMDLTFSFVFTAARIPSVRDRLLQGLNNHVADGWSIGDHSFEFNPNSQYVFVRPTVAPSPGDINISTMIPYDTFRRLMNGELSCREGIRYL